MNESEKIRVLIADDEESFQRVLNAVLESTNRFEVYPCESGEEAVEALTRSQFDVVILDYVMPGMSGLNVLQWMHEQKLSTPVILLTGAGSENIAVEAMKLGAYDYLRKDQFDRNHFPIIVYGVYERFLFKIEKEQRERNVASLDIIRNTISSFSEIVTAAIAKLAFLTDESERLFRSQVSHQGKDDFAVYVRKVREELETLAFATKSINNLPKAADQSIAPVQMPQTQPEKVLVTQTSTAEGQNPHSS
jgi:CheY-like chemotaxis protein